VDEPLRGLNALAGLGAPMGFVDEPANCSGGLVRVAGPTGIVDKPGFLGELTESLG